MVNRKIVGGLTLFLLIVYSTLCKCVSSAGVISNIVVCFITISRECVPSVLIRMPNKESTAQGLDPSKI